MSNYASLIRILELSVQRSPEKPLTNSHLLNIVKMATKRDYAMDEQHQEWLDHLERDALGQDGMWG